MNTSDIIATISLIASVMSLLVAYKTYSTTNALSLTVSLLELTKEIVSLRERYISVRVMFDENQVDESMNELLTTMDDAVAATLRWMEDESTDSFIISDRRRQLVVLRGEIDNLERLSAGQKALTSADALFASSGESRKLFTALQASLQKRGIGLDPTADESLP